MLEPIRHIIAAQRNVLASASPRRREILASIGLPVEIVPSNFIEDLDKDSFSHPCEYVKETAKQKAVEVWKRLAESSPSTDTRPDLVIGADTVVTMDEIIYEKPKDADDALSMLSKLSGQKHTVFTGVALVTPSPGKPVDPNDSFLVTTFHEGTDVVMAEMTETIIKAYIKTGEPMDKAGGYGIQGIGGSLIEGIRGDYYNVMGLPLHRLCKELFHMYSD